MTITPLQYPISPLTGQFCDPSQERAFHLYTWPQQGHIRGMSIIALINFLLLCSYFDHLTYGTTTHFWTLFVLRAFMAIAGFFMAWLTFQKRPHPKLDLYIVAYQGLFLLFGLFILQDRLIMGQSYLQMEAVMLITFISYPFITTQVLVNRTQLSMLSNDVAFISFLMISLQIPNMTAGYKAASLIGFLFSTFYFIDFK